MARVCDIGLKDLMRGAILNSVASDPRTNGMVEGQSYDASEARVEALNEIGLTHAAQLYRVESGGDRIVFAIEIPDTTIDSYTQTSSGKRTTFQTQTRNDAPSNSIANLAKGLQERIAEDAKQLQAFADKVMLSAKNIERYVKGDAELSESMSEVWTSLKQDPNGEAKIKMISQFLAEAKNFLELKRLQIEGLFKDPDGVEGDEALMIEIEKQVDLYAPLVTEFHNFLGQAPPKNPIKILVDKTFGDMAAIKAVAHNVHKNSAWRALFDVLAPSMEKAKTAMEADIRVLEDNLTRANDKGRLLINKKIARIRADIEEFANSDKIMLTLIGENADSTQIGKFLVSAMGNKDILIQGFGKIVKDKYQAAQMEYQPIGAEIGDRFQALNMSMSNIDEAFKDLYTEVEESYYDEASDEIVTSKVLYFVGETSEHWRTEFSLLKADLSKSGKNIMEKRRAGATADELRPLEIEHDRKKTEYIKWRRANFETEYGDRYQAADAMLDTPIIIRGVPVTPREVRATYYDEINSIQTTVNALSGIPTEDEIARINDIRQQFEAVKSLSGKVEGSGEWQMAKVFTDHAAEMKEMTDRWEISSASQDRFNTRKADVDKKFEAGEITKEERDRWYTSNTTTVYNPRYWAERRATVETLNSLAEEMSRITGVVKETNIKVNYEEMEAVCKKYRDSYSHIDGTKLTAAEREKVLQSEEDIEDLKRSMKQAYSGFLGEEFQGQVDEMQRQIDILDQEKQRLRREDPARSTRTKQEIAEITRQQKALKSSEKALAAKYLTQKGVSKEDIKAFQDLYDKYMGAVRHLSELTESVETKYYYDTYQAELNKFIAGKTQTERAAKIASTKVVSVGKTKYKKVGDQFYEVLFDGTVAEEPTSGEALLDHIYRKEFEDSAWFQDNHFEAEKWEDGGMKKKMVPIYSWRISEPRDKRWIKEYAPNIAWKQRVIKDEYRNHNYGITADGHPKLKEGLHRSTGYEALRAKNPALWEFRDFMIDEVFLKAQQEDLPDQRTLGMRVPTIERDLSLYDVAQRRGKGVGQRVARKLKLNPQDVDEGVYAYADESGHEKKFIPIKYQGRLEADLVSRNIVETIGQYAAEAKLYKARTELLDIGKSMEKTFQAHPPSSESLDKGAKFMGVFRRNKKLGENHRLDTLKNMIDMWVYGEMSSEKSEAGKKIHKVLSNLLGVKASLLFSELPNLVSHAVGGSGMFLGSTLSQAVNQVGGDFQALIHTAAGSGDAKFTISDWVWATAEYAKNGVAFTKDIGKVSNRSFWTEFAEFFDARELHYTDNFGKQLYSKGLLRQINMSNLAFAKNIVEHDLTLRPMMAFSRNYHVDGPDGKIALKDAFEMVGGRLQMKEGVNISDAELSNIRGYIAAILRNTNGNYGKLDKTYAETDWRGKSMLFMRKWLIPLVANKYAGKKFSVEQDRVVTGYLWESTKLAFEALNSGNAGKPSPKTWIGWVPHIAKGIAGADAREIAAIFHPSMSRTLTAQEQDSLRKTRLEILMLISMWLAYRFAMGFDKDDPDRYKKLKKDSVLLQSATYVLIKSTSEQATFVPPAGFSEIGKVGGNLFSNTAPIVSDLWKIMANDLNYTEVGSRNFFERYKVDTETHKRGDTKAAAHLWKLLGLSASKEGPIPALKAYEVSLSKQ